MKKGIMALGALISGIAGGVAISNYFSSKVIKEKTSKVDKFKSYYNILNMWMINKNDGKKIEDYFIKKDYKNIAIYGMGELGNRLYEELKDSNVKVVYAIDKNPSTAYGELDIYDIDDELSDVDAVIVTAVFAFDDIENSLNNRMNCPIISLEDVIYNN